MATLRLRNLRKSYADVEVIKGVDLDINDRDFVVFVGPSGCGKSTLLRMIAGLEEISSGELMIDGERVNDVPPAERGLAMVFQSYALYPHMTVRDNMGFALRLAGVPKAERERKVREAAQVLQLGEYLDRKPRALSGGQRQRVAIGRAIVREPKVFLFDEPLSNLDAALRVQMRIELARLHDALDATMIYVTHDQVEAMTLADKIVVLQGGIIEQTGSPLELYHHPENLFVAGFIGSPKMNFMEAKAVGADASGVTVELVNKDRIKVDVAPGQVAEGEPLTLGVRPEHLRVTTDGGDVRGEVLVAERLGGDTYLYTQITNGVMLVVQADGENATRVHDRIGVAIDGRVCHLFKQDGSAVRRARRHPLADIKDPTAHAAA
ncbi:MAG: transporter [Geminicoccaceae bacterium]|jgi:multiple sugar transport system ATP-binding protein|nr:transporter [Geminicoccaceae bacterium]